MPISVRSERGATELAKPLGVLVKAALAVEQRRAGEICIVLADDATLRSLNRQWRGIDRATDVLSFAYGEAADGLKAPVSRPVRAGSSKSETKRDSGGRAKGVTSFRRTPVNGDLVISVDRMREQAKRYHLSEAWELARLVVHGTLHLAGLDHQREAERRHMRSHEYRALGGPSIAAIVKLDRLLKGLARSTRS